MADKSTISISFRLDGDDKEIKSLANSSDGLRTVLKSTASEADGLKKSLINWSQATQAISSISSILKDVSGALGEMSDKMKDVQQENILTNQLTGKTGEDMHRLRNAVKATADYFGEDFAAAMRAANALAQGFGISIDDAVQLMRDGLVSGANANGDFIDTLREYPRYFKEAGISAEEFVAIATNAAKQGIYSDKGVDVIKEANLRLREMTSSTAEALNNIGISSEEVQSQLQDGLVSTFDVMRMVGDKLKELPANSAAVGAAIADIFGGPGEDAGLAYLQSLSDIQLSMDAVKSSAGEYAQLQERQIVNQEDLKNSLSGLIDLSAVYTNVQPYVDFAAQVGMAAMGITTFATTIKAALPTITAFQMKAKLAGVAALLTGTNASKSAALVRVFSAAMTTGAYKATALKVALKGLLITTGIGAAFVALTTALEAFFGAAEEAAEETGSLSQELEDLKKTSRDISTEMAQSIQKEITELDNLISKAKDDTKSREERTKAIEELQGKYPDYFSNLKAEALDVDALTKGYNNLRASILKAAKARAIQSKLETNTGEILALEEKAQKAAEITKRYVKPGMTVGEKRKALRTAYEDGSISDAEKEILRESEILLAKRKELKSSQEYLLNELDKINKETVKAEEDINSPTTKSSSPRAITTNHELGYDANASNLAGYKANINALTEELQTATLERAAAINQEIVKWRELASAVENAGAAVEEVVEVAPETPLAEQSLNLTASSLQDIEHNIAILQAQLNEASISEAAGINQSIKLWQDKADAIRNAGVAAEQTNVKISDSLIGVWGGVKNINSSITSMVDAIEGSGTAWEKTIAIIDGIIGLYEGIMSIVSIIQMITGATQLLTGAKIGESVAVGASTSANISNVATMSTLLGASIPAITANKMLAASYRELAAAEYMAAHAYIPFAGFGIAAGFTASMMALVQAAGVPLLAEGGIASGPTLAMVGEYAGAKGNPEVIAPLNKLRDMLGDTGLGGQIEFKIKGRNLVAILENENNRIRRS